MTQPPPAGEAMSRGKGDCGGQRGRQLPARPLITPTKVFALPTDGETTTPTRWRFAP
ncbi:MAG TPA: hypothetical protein VFC13_09970 [Actinomycetes bacterium]|jgi:hypothetical protein|nr:hypothetical protein [Actinomycetes bacterium]